MKKNNTVWVLALLAVALSGCEQKIENCWSENTKTTTTDIIKSNLTKQIAAILKVRDGQPGSDEKKKDIASRLTITLSDYYVVNHDAPAQRLTCGAQAHIIYKRPDNTTISGENDIEFSVYKAEHENIISVPIMAITKLLNSASE